MNYCQKQWIKERIMKSIFTTLMTLLLVVSLQAQPNQYLTILHLNDTHSNMLAGTPRSPQTGQGLVGGAARAATYVQSCYGETLPPVLLHAGDAFFGDPMFNLLALPPGTQRSVDLEALMALNCDAMALGNHEFDAGPDLLTEVITNTFGLVPDYVNEPDIPLLSANLEIPASYPNAPVLAGHIHPYTIVERGPFKIGIIGLTTPSTNATSMPSPLRIIGMDETEIGQVLAQVGGIAQDLIVDQDCNYIILLSHMGMELDKLIATNVPLINIIVGGHDHLATKKPVVIQNAMTGEDVYIVQTEGFYRQIGNIELRMNNGEITLQHYKLVDLDASIQEDQTMLAALDPAVQGIEAYVPGMFSMPITSCSCPFTEVAHRLRTPGPKDTRVGNLVSDAFQDMTGADIGLQPGGSTAQALYHGPILPVDIFRMIGYGANDVDAMGFPVVLFDITGAELAKGLEFTLADIDVEDEYFLQVSRNLKYVYDPTKPAGSRLSAVLFKGSPLDMTATYSVATNELVVLFLNALGVGYSNLSYYPDANSEFELLVNYIVGTGLTSLPCGPHAGRIVATPSPILPNPTASTPPMAKITNSSPNPFIGETAVQFEVNGEMAVSVKVYDVIGREVATLHDGYATTGVHTALFNADGLPSGMYFCRMLTADGTVQTLKMLKTR